MKINRDAQMNLVAMALPLLSPEGTVVLVTSHWAHLYGRIPQLPAYEPVARSKNAGEMALRSLLVSHASAVRLIVVTGDLVDGTVTPKLLERVSRGLADRRRSEMGALPTVEDMAAAIVSAAFDKELESGHTVVVGGDLESLSAQLSV
jgi:NAD(P)-dependent dehydrogenase (short-subunit alcohol dehydrogenase family)